MKKVCLVLVMMIMFTLALSMTTFALIASDMIIDGKEIVFSKKPVSIKGKLVAPAKEFTSNLQANMEWDEKTKTVTISKGEATLKLTLNSNIAYINNKQEKIEVAPIYTNNVVMIPVRYIAENLGYTVEWDSTRSAVTLNDKNDPILAAIPNENKILYQAIKKMQNFKGRAGVYSSFKNRYVTLNEDFNVYINGNKMDVKHRDKETIIDNGDLYLYINSKWEKAPFKAPSGYRDKDAYAYILKHFNNLEIKKVVLSTNGIEMDTYEVKIPLAPFMTFIPDDPGYIIGVKEDKVVANATFNIEGGNIMYVSADLEVKSENGNAKRGVLITFTDIGKEYNIKTPTHYSMGEYESEE